MNKKYINIYNTLINLTRDKKLYTGFKNQDTFSDRMVFLLLHFSFFLKAYNKECSKKTLQDVFDYFFNKKQKKNVKSAYNTVKTNVF